MSASRRRLTGTRLPWEDSFMNSSSEGEYIESSKSQIQIPEKSQRAGSFALWLNLLADGDANEFSVWVRAGLTVLRDEASFGDDFAANFQPSHAADGERGVEDDGGSVADN